jgi:hypothetical protein
MSGLCYGHSKHLECVRAVLNLMSYTFLATDTNKQIHHKQIALVLKIRKALLHVSATVRGHIQGVSVFNDTYSTIIACQ